MVPTLILGFHYYHKNHWIFSITSVKAELTEKRYINQHKTDEKKTFAHIPIDKKFGKSSIMQNKPKTCCSVNSV